MDDFESVVDYSIFHRAMVNISHWESLAVGYSQGGEKIGRPIMGRIRI